jgi:hypothetical protein
VNDEAFFRPAELGWASEVTFVDLVEMMVDAGPGGAQPVGAAADLFAMPVKMLVAGSDPVVVG